MPTKEEIIEVLKTIEDPDIQLDIWFLGFIYRLALHESKVLIDMTLTSPMCPYGPALVGEVQEKVSELAGVEDVIVNITFDPPWEPSDEVKGLLGFL